MILELNKQSAGWNTESRTKGKGKKTEGITLEEFKTVKPAS